MLASANRDDIDLAPELWVDYGPRNDARVVHAEFREKAKAHSRGAHRKNPIVALAAEYGRPGDAALLPRQRFIELAMDPVEIALIVPRSS